jgi:ferrous iron transport protein A
MSEVLLSNLNLGEKAVVVDFKDEDLSLKLLEMGCLPGVEIEVLHLEILLR